MNSEFILNVLESVHVWYLDSISDRRCRWEDMEKRCIRRRNQCLCVTGEEQQLLITLKEDVSFFYEFLERGVWKVDFLYRRADCVDEMIVLTVRCHSYPRTHVPTVSLSLISSNQATVTSTSHIMVRPWFWWGVGWVTIVGDESVLANEDICPCCWQRIQEILNTADLGNTVFFGLRLIFSFQLSTLLLYNWRSSKEGI